MKIIITDFAGAQYYIGNMAVEAIKVDNLSYNPETKFSIKINNVEIPLKRENYIVKFNTGELIILSEDVFNQLFN